MRDLIQLYKKSLILWYLASVFLFISVFFSSSQIIKFLHQAQNLQTLKTHKTYLLSQLGNLNFWISQIDLTKISEPQPTPVSGSFEINSISEILPHLSYLYSEKGTIFRIKSFNALPCQKEENSTFNSTCFFKIEFSGEKIKYYE